MATKDRLPGKPVKCGRCGERFVWARTVAQANGGGGKAMPLDLAPNPDGNVAVRETNGHRLVARVLEKGESHDRYAEVLAMPHFATCGKKLVPEIEAFLAEAAKGGEPS